MAFIGTPLDTRNTFQSLQGKRFNGDGSTTDFTLDVAPASTLDIEVFVGNVRQDPNSAYTLSGTTLSFTGAPPSGTNNIYVVHQAKAVGTINPGANSVGVTELNLSDGSNGQFIKTDGSGTLSFATVSTGVALDDVSTGDAASTLATSAGDITIDAQGNDTDIIFKGTDGGADTTFLTIDGSAAGASAFNSYITSTAIYGKGDDNTGIQFDGSDVISYHTGGTNRMTMASNGDIHFPNTSGSGYFTFKTASSEPYVVHNGTATGTTTVYMFKVGGTEVGTINRTSSATQYNTSSDYRLKENETAITDGITRLKQLKPYRFNWKADSGGDKVDGFFAHEVSSIVPEAIFGTKDAMTTDDDGKSIINPQQIDQAKLVPLLTAAIIELEARVKTLEDA